MEEKMKGKVIERLRRISQNEEWIQRLLDAPTVEELNRLLQQKKVTVSELQESLGISRQAGESSALSEQQLESVSGGGLIGNCPEKYDWWLCSFSCCSHIKTEGGGPYGADPRSYCDLGYWDYRKKE